MFKGWFGEKKTQFSLWVSLNRRVYCRYHDLIIPTHNGTAQLDHVLVSPFGIFIVETKNLRGWIYGDPAQSRWTQVLFRKKNQFQNPLRQTYRQMKVLSEYLNVSEVTIHPVIAFVGACEFKTEMPPNVRRSGVGGYIKSFTQVVYDENQLKLIQFGMERLAVATDLSASDHLRSLRERHNSKTVCPRCGSDLVTRTVKRGRNEGSQFLGCQAYPKCRFTRDI